MSFPPAFLDELRSKIPATVIGRSVRLVRAGKQWKGCCPYHFEKTPSFYVYEDGQYHCFGCSAHGDVIGYLMQTEKLSFAEAVAQLAAEAGLALPKGAANTSVRLSQQAAEARIFQNGGIDSILAIAARVLLKQQSMSEAGLLANAEMSVAYRDGCWRLSIGIPVESYLELEGRGYIENTIDSALTIPMEAVSRSDHLYCEIVTSLEPDPQLAATDTAMSRWRRGNQPGACAQRQNSDPRT